MMGKITYLKGFLDVIMNRIHDIKVQRGVTKWRLQILGLKRLQKKGK